MSSNVRTLAVNGSNTLFAEPIPWQKRLVRPLRVNVRFPGEWAGHVPVFKEEDVIGDDPGGQGTEMGQLLIFCGA